MGYPKAPEERNLVFQAAKPALKDHRIRHETMSQSDDDNIDPLGSTTLGDLDTMAETESSLARLILDVSSSFEGERYELVSELASGGMGTVWLANDKLLAREVAVKVLHRKFEPNREAKLRFEYEARLTGRLVFRHAADPGF